MATQYAQSATAAEVPAQTSAEKRYLIGPVADFLTFGGSSLIILPLLLLIPAAPYQAGLAAAMMLAANFINHPHFAHSYQIFYRGFRAKAFSPELSAVLRGRYLFAGVIAPLLLIAFFAYCFLTRDLQLLAYGGNAMALFVGWHYVKQGYGLLMVDCTLKRRFFTDAEKKLLLINSYAVWIAAWTQFNADVTRAETGGLAYYSFGLPGPVVMLALAAALGTSAATAWMLLKRWHATGALPTNGVIAYFVSLYPWLLLINFNPLWGLVIPALHSLQYLAVVWRFQTNYERAQLERPEYKAGSLTRQLCGSNPFAHLALFVAVGGALGYCGFILFPTLFSVFVPYDKAVFGAAAFVFAFWVFINVHHYFIDNVIWRRENPDAKRYLFS